MSAQDETIAALLDERRGYVVRGLTDPTGMASWVNVESSDVETRLMPAPYAPGSAWAPQPSLARVPGPWRVRRLPCGLGAQVARRPP